MLGSWKTATVYLALSALSHAQPQRTPSLADAEQMVQRSDFAGAVSVCKKLLQRNPASAEVHTVLGIAYASLGERAPAITAFQEAIQLQPSLAAAHANLGIVYMESNEMQRATAALEKASQLGDQDWSTLYNLALCRIATGQLQQAKSLLARVVAAVPEAGPPRLDLASVLLELGEKEAGLREVKDLESRAAGDPDLRQKIGALLLKHGRSEDAAGHLAFSLEQRPQDVSTRLQLAEAYIQSGSYQSTIRTLQALPPGTDASQQAVAHYLTARAYAGSKDPLRALDYYEKAVAVDPKPVYYTTLVKALLWSGAMEDALQVARSAVEKFPKSIEVLEALGGAAMVNRVSDEAIRAYQQILAIRPGEEEASLQLGNVYLTDGKFEEARNTFQSLSRRAAKNDNTRFGLALVEIRQGREVEAKPLLDETVRLNPEHAGALYYLGKVHYAQEEFSQALQYLRRSAAAQPADSEDLSSTHYMMARCYLKLGDRENAEKEFAMHKQLRERQP